MRFVSRQDAGQKLGHHLLKSGVTTDYVVGLPRGGVVVGAKVACLLQRPLGVLVVRKIGHPLHREFAVGALAENDVMVLDQAAMAGDISLSAELQDVIAEERTRLLEYQKKFHDYFKLDLNGKRILLVDDGLATGATAQAAVLSAKKQGARMVCLAVPVASPDALGRLARTADMVTALVVDPAFGAVGQYYRHFDPTTDAEVLALLRGAGESVGR